ncbi:MAG: tetratricopeptide repeat protein, partial [Verrucomicrobiae bacterium]|nr:tetratricopeptide repeat protein [Verrucomicrobiae bacterium]
MILVEDWTPGAPFDEVLPFLWQHGDLLRNDTPSARWERNPVFAHLAREALKQNDPLRALTWYGFLLNPHERITHWENRIAELAKVVPGDDAARDRLNAAREEAETELAKARDSQAALLLGVGSGHFQMGNASAAYAAFREVTDHHPDHPQRPDAIYNLIASCAHLARWGEIRGYGNEFLDHYPEHPLIAEVARLMAESIYVQGEWEEARQTGVALRERFPRRDVAADVPDYVAAASLFQLGRHEEAATELDTYLKRYAKPRRAEPATFYLGASKMQLFLWKEGVEILEKFEETFPDSSLRPSALYQAALGRFALGELDDAAANAERL